MSRRTLAALAAIVGVAVAITVTLVLITGRKSTPKPPIILVHGYALTTGCPGGDVRLYWSGLTAELVAAGWTNPVVPVSYYECDRNGTNIAGSSKTDVYFGAPAGTAGSAGYSQNTDLRHLAYVLAWYVYDNYSSNGQTVDLVGHSMGGLMIRWALSRVAAHDAAFPPYLTVSNVVTISTPYGGAIPAVKNLVACKDSFECTQFEAGSAFLTDLAAGPAPSGVDWTAMGGGACDLMTAASATDVTPAHHLSWSQPCYDHSKILFDDSATFDTTAVFSSPGDPSPTTTQSAPHSLAAVLRALQTTSW
jgi:pimeloyl-ACP methyl ester carboxylesterase